MPAKTSYHSPAVLFEFLSHLLKKLPSLRCDLSIRFHKERQLYFGSNGLTTKILFLDKEEWPFSISDWEEIEIPHVTLNFLRKSDLIFPPQCSFLTASDFQVFPFYRFDDTPPPPPFYIICATWFASMIFVITLLHSFIDFTPVNSLRKAFILKHKSS